MKAKGTSLCVYNSLEIIWKLHTSFQHPDTSPDHEQGKKQMVTQETLFTIDITLRTIKSLFFEIPGCTM